MRNELHPFIPSIERKATAFRCPQDDRVGFLDLSRGFADYPPPSSTIPIQPQETTTLPVPQLLPSFELPSEVRMITYSDEIPRPDLPTPPAPALPSLTESPLTLLIAASGGKLDLNWLETFDNSTLETLVPRDPHTGRPLTIGSIEHIEGRCRPCIFFLRAKCFKGLRCTFCHFNHTTLRRNITSEEIQQEGPAGVLGTEDRQLTAAAAAAITPSLSPTVSSVVCIGQPGAVSKSKRLRPSKRTREMIKQINEQILLGDYQHHDPNGPPLSVTETVPM